MWMHLGKNWKQFPDAEELDEEFREDDAYWREKEMPNTTRNMLAERAREEQQHLRAMASDRVARRLLNRIPWPDLAITPAPNFCAGEPWPRMPARLQWPSGEDE
jgi:hypothetical protein